jgi:hypothetical protein
MAVPGEAPPRAVPAVDVRAARSAMGSLTPLAISGAEEAIARIPGPVADAVRNPFDARAAVCLLLLSRDHAERRRQLGVLASCDGALADATRRLAGSAEVGAGQRLAVLELAAASLALLSPAQYASFRTALAQLIAADGQVDRLEWTVRVLLRQAVESRGAAPGRGTATDDDLATVVSVLAWSGAQDEPAAMRAWAAARATFGRLGASPVPAASCTLDALDASLRAFAGSSPAMRRRLVDACVAAVTADGRTTVEEAELLRAVCAAIGAPMPPLAAAA